MTPLQFCIENPGVVLTMLCLTYLLIYNLTALVCRHLNVRKHGWPPDRCDSDAQADPATKKDPEV